MTEVRVHSEDIPKQGETHHENELWRERIAQREKHPVRKSPAAMRAPGGRRVLLLAYPAVTCCAALLFLHLAQTAAIGLSSNEPSLVIEVMFSASSSSSDLES